MPGPRLSPRGALSTVGTLRNFMSLIREMSFDEEREQAERMPRLLVIASDTEGGRKIGDSLTGMPGSAAVTVMMYADFLCPRCRDLDAQLRPVRASHRWSIVHRQYPLESECNPNVKRTSARHRGSCLLARSAICAGILGRYDEFSDGIFDRGPREEQALVELAGSLGLDRAAFETCLRSDQAAKRLAEDIESGREAGVRATPTVVVDGRPHVGTLGAADLVCVRGAPADRPRP